MTTCCDPEKEAADAEAVAAEPSQQQQQQQQHRAVSKVAELCSSSGLVVTESLKGLDSQLGADQAAETSAGRRKAAEKGKRRWRAKRRERAGPGHGKSSRDC